MGVYPACWKIRNATKNSHALSEDVRVKMKILKKGNNEEIGDDRKKEKHRWGRNDLQGKVPCVSRPKPKQLLEGFVGN